MLLWGASASAAETMRIALGAETKAATVVGPGLFAGEDLDDGAFEQLGRTQVVVERQGSRLMLNGVALPRGAVRLRADENSPLAVNGTKVRGDVVAVLGKDGVQLVNVIALEDYLVGVLGSEMPPSFPLEALKAQAVAARTYALQKKLEQYGQPFYLGSNVISQVYRGLSAESERTREAVRATSGMVLTYQLQPIEAYFHASCGGKTETGLQALGRDLPYLQSVSCPCHKLPQSEWSLTLSGPELGKLGGSKGSGIQVAGRTPTGRATRVQVGSRSYDAQSFRERVGYQRLKSLSFDVHASGGGVTLSGHGFGHGSGLCQWGAKVLAERGKGFVDILAHYYPGTELQTLY